MAMPEVIECMFLFGEWDYVLNIATYRSTLIMRVVKHTTVLPV